MTDKKNILAPLCKKAYACREEHSYCRPAFPIDGDNFYFIGQSDQSEEECLYKKKYGSLHTCDCPVRLEIYQRYKI